MTTPIIRFPTVPMALAEESPIDRAAQSIYAAVATFYDEPARSQDEAIRVAAIVGQLVEYLAATHLAVQSRVQGFECAPAICYVSAVDYATYFEGKD